LKPIVANLKESEIADEIAVPQGGSATIKRVHLSTLELGTVHISGHTQTPRKPHLHPEHQVFYIFNGSGRITNRKDVTKKD